MSVWQVLVHDYYYIACDVGCWLPIAHDHGTFQRTSSCFHPSSPTSTDGELWSRSEVMVL